MRPSGMSETLYCLLFIFSQLDFNKARAFSIGAETGSQLLENLNNNNDGPAFQIFTTTSSDRGPQNNQVFDIIVHSGGGGAADDQHSLDQQSSHLEIQQTPSDLLNTQSQVINSQLEVDRQPRNIPVESLSPSSSIQPINLNQAQTSWNKQKPLFGFLSNSQPMASSHDQLEQVSNSIAMDDIEPQSGSPSSDLTSSTSIQNAARDRMLANFYSPEPAKFFGSTRPHSQLVPGIGKALPPSTLRRNYLQNHHQNAIITQVPISARQRVQDFGQSLPTESHHSPNPMFSYGQTQTPLSPLIGPKVRGSQLVAKKTNINNHPHQFMQHPNQSKLQYSDQTSLGGKRTEHGPSDREAPETQSPRGRQPENNKSISNDQLISLIDELKEFNARQTTIGNKQHEVTPAPARRKLPESLRRPQLEIQTEDSSDGDSHAPSDDDRPLKTTRNRPENVLDNENKQLGSAATNSFLTGEELEKIANSLMGVVNKGDAGSDPKEGAEFIKSEQSEELVVPRPPKARKKWTGGPSKDKLGNNNSEQQLETATGVASKKKQNQKSDSKLEGKFNNKNKNKSKLDLEDVDRKHGEVASQIEALIDSLSKTTKKVEKMKPVVVGAGGVSIDDDSIDDQRVSKSSIKNKNKRLNNNNNLIGSNKTQNFKDLTSLMIGQDGEGSENKGSEPVDSSSSPSMTQVASSRKRREQRTVGNINNDRDESSDSQLQQHAKNKLSKNPSKQRNHEAGGDKDGNFAKMLISQELLEDQLESAQRPKLEDQYLTTSDHLSVKSGMISNQSGGDDDAATQHTVDHSIPKKQNNRDSWTREDSLSHDDFIDDLVRAREGKSALRGRMTQGKYLKNEPLLVKALSGGLDVTTEKRPNGHFLVKSNSGPAEIRMQLPANNKRRSASSSNLETTRTIDSNDTPEHGSEPVPLRVEPNPNVHVDFEENASRPLQDEYPISAKVSDRLDKLSSNLDQFFDDRFMQQIEEKSKYNINNSDQSRGDSREPSREASSRHATKFTKTKPAKDRDFDVNVGIDGKVDSEDPPDLDEQDPEDEGSSDESKSSDNGLNKNKKNKGAKSLNKGSRAVASREASVRSRLRNKQLKNKNPRSMYSVAGVDATLATANSESDDSNGYSKQNQRKRKEHFNNQNNNQDNEDKSKSLLRDELNQKERIEFESSGKLLSDKDPVENETLETPIGPDRENNTVDLTAGVTKILKENNSTLRHSSGRRGNPSAKFFEEPSQWE